MPLPVVDRTLMNISIDMGSFPVASNTDYLYLAPFRSRLKHLVVNATAATTGTNELQVVTNGTNVPGAVYDLGVLAINTSLVITFPVDVVIAAGDMIWVLSDGPRRRRAARSHSRRGEVLMPAANLPRALDRWGFGALDGFYFIRSRSTADA